MEGNSPVGKISLICEQCGGSVVLDNTHEYGVCEYCRTSFLIKNDTIVQKITQHITKYVYGYEGKDVEELLTDGYRLIELGDSKAANTKFRQALAIEPDCWSARLGYASTGGDRTQYLSIVPAYRQAYNAATREDQELDTFADMVRYLPDQHLRAAFIRAFNIAPQKIRSDIFELVSGVIGCDESEIASLAIDLCPDDWRSHFAMAKFRQIRVRWCTLEGSFFTGKHLPNHAIEVLNIFLRAYRLASSESNTAREAVLSYIDTMTQDNSYKVFVDELKTQIKREG